MPVIFLYLFQQLFISAGFKQALKSDCHPDKKVGIGDFRIFLFKLAPVAKNIVKIFIKAGVSLILLIRDAAEYSIELAGLGRCV